MPGHPRLYRRGAMYYHRAAIPVDISDTYPKSEETFTLKTSDYREAVRLVRIAAAETDRKFEAHRRQLAEQSRPPVQELTDDQIKRIGDAYYAFRLEEDEESRLDSFYDEDAPMPDLPAPSFDEYVDDTDALDELNRANYARGKTDVFFTDEAREILTWDNVNIRLAPSSPSWPKITRVLQAATIRATEAIRARNQGNVIETPRISGVASQAVAPLLSVAVEDWINEKVRTRWVPKTEREHRVWMGHFIAVIGDRPFNTYTKSDGRAFKAILLKLPANWNKVAALKDLPLDKAADKAAELNLPPMSDSNVNKLMKFVGSFWTWAADNYDDAPPSPFKKLRIKVRGNVRDERDPFALEELRAILSAPLYTGCKSARNWKQPGKQIPRDTGKFWVPLISMFTGARSGEVIQLYTEDVREEEGVLYFDINENGDDKRVKNSNSKRVIPVHPALIQMGLLEHVEQRRKQGEKRLFPELKKGADGYYSSPFSKYFNDRFLPSVGVKRRKNAFHSFRHSFEDACRDSDVSKEIMDALQGHGEQGMSKRYGRGYFLRKLDEAMKKVRYRDLTLSHLDPSG